MLRKIQKSVFDTLTANSALVALLADHSRLPSTAAIYDAVLQPADAGNDALFPFVVIGDITGIDRSAFAANSIDANITIHCFSRYRGKSEIHNIQTQIYNSLHKKRLTNTGGSYFENSTIFLDDSDDDNMLTYHGVQFFRILANE